MIKKILLVSILFLGIFGFVSAQEKVEVNFFYSKTCPHCAAEKSFLENEIVSDYSEVEFNKFLISENVDLLKDFYRDYNVSSEQYGLVPVVFIGNNYFVGFNDQTGDRIEECVSDLIEGKKTCISSEEVSLPFLGEIDTSKYSLPALSVILGFFDGFNVCSLGALVLILGLVLTLREKKKIFLYGVVFIATTALVYGLLIIVWHQIFSLLASYLRGMEIVIGVLGVLGGVYFFREFIRFRKYGPACQNTSKGIVSKLTLKVKKTLQESESIFLIVLSILAFAAAITIVEFPCSAAIPVFFASLLADAGLSVSLYLLYIAIFVFFYMLDEIVVFAIAFFTISIRIASPKFTVWITLVESLFLFALGVFYLFGI